MDGGPARNSPKSRNVPDLERRIEKLEAYERWGDVRPLDFGDLAGAQDWDAYWSHLEIIEKQMREAQAHAERIRETIRARMHERGLGAQPFADLSDRA